MFVSNETPSDENQRQKTVARFKSALKISKWEIC